jgi:hypothetical protein
MGRADGLSEFRGRGVISLPNRMLSDLSSCSSGDQRHMAAISAMKVKKIRFTAYILDGRG